jgi:hypothetical protein
VSVRMEFSIFLTDQGESVSSHVSEVIRMDGPGFRCRLSSDAHGHRYRDREPNRSTGRRRACGADPPGSRLQANLFGLEPTLFCKQPDFE